MRRYVLAFAVGVIAGVLAIAAYATWADAVDSSDASA